MKKRIVLDITKEANKACRILKNEDPNDKEIIQLFKQMQKKVKSVKRNLQHLEQTISTVLSSMSHPRPVTRGAQTVWLDHRGDMYESQLY